MLGSSQRGFQRSTPLNQEAAPRAQESPLPAAGQDAGLSTEVQGRIAALESLILSRLDDDKAQDVVFIDLKGKSAMADGLVVASGRSHRHVGAMADHLLEKLKAAGHGRASSEGKSVGDWVLVDAGDVIVHVFRPEIRELYQLERMWSFPDDETEAKPKRKRKKAAAAEDAA